MAAVRLTSLSLAAACLLTVPLAAAADTSITDGDDSARILILVRQLGHSRFQSRQQAAEDLKEIGLPALPALQKALVDDDPEIRHRSRRLIDEIERRAYEQRLEAYLSDPEGAPDDLLPGLDVFRETIGVEPAACRLLVDMLRAEPDLFRAWEEQAPRVADEFVSQFSRVQRACMTKQTREAAQTSVCALMFVGADPEVPVAEPMISGVSNFARYREFRELLNGPHAEAYRKLLGRWIARPGAVGAAQKMTLAMQYDLSEGLIPAQETIARGNRRSATRQYSILAIGKLGGSEHLPLLERLLKDDHVLAATRTRGKVTYSIKTQDVALAALLHMTGQKPKGYHFKRLRRNAISVFSLSTAGFYNEEDRFAALEKWAAWREMHSSWPDADSDQVQLTD